MLFDKRPEEDTPRMLFGKQRSKESALCMLFVQRPKQSHTPSRRSCLAFPSSRHLGMESRWHLVQRRAAQSSAGKGLPEQLCHIFSFHWVREVVRTKTFTQQSQFSKR